MQYRIPKYTSLQMVLPLCVNKSNNYTKARFHVELSSGLAFGTPKFYIAPYGKINHELINLSPNCDVKSGLRGVHSHEGSITDRFRYLQVPHYRSLSAYSSHF